MTSKKRTLTGYRPTGKLHIGHWFGNLQNMLELQHDYDAYYFIADFHALTTHWADPSDVRASTEEMVLDWCAAGLDPEVCTIYRQSDVPEVAELNLFFSMVTPMSWLERVPSYKEQREQVTDKDLGNAGFFLYPLLQAADITIVRADNVPVGEDQLPHLELTREVVRRFNNAYGEYLVEPKAIIAEVRRARAGHRRSQDVEELRQRDLHQRHARRDAQEGHVVRHRPAAQAQDRSGRPRHLPAASGPQAVRPRR